MTEVYSPSPNIDQSDLPILPANWQWVQFKETCDRVSVGHVGPTTEFFTDTPDGICFLRSQNVRPGKLELENALSITPNFHEKLKKSQLIEGDILIVRVGANRGDCCVVPSGVGELNCANIVFARPKEPNGFHAYFFQSDLGRKLLLSASVGAAQGVINTGSVATMPVPCPPITVQRRIADILSAYDELIENSQQRIRTLELMARNLYREWFIQFRFPGHESVSLVPSSLGDIPQGWEVKNLGSLADIKWGDTSTTKESYVEKGYAAYSASGLDGQLDHYDFDRMGIVLSAIGAQCGKTWLASGKWSCIKNTIRFWAKNECVSTEFLFIATEGQDFWPRRGAAQPFISQGDAEKIDVLIPDRATMERFTTFVADSLKHIATFTIQIQNLRRTRDLLLPRLLSGQINVEAIAS
jgi:type I restriction enzyme S subunit